MCGITKVLDCTGHHDEVKRVIRNGKRAFFHVGKNEINPLSAHIRCKVGVEIQRHTLSYRCRLIRQEPGIPRATIQNPYAGSIREVLIQNIFQ